MVTVDGHLQTLGLIRFLSPALGCGRPSAASGFTCWFDLALCLLQQFPYPVLYIPFRSSGSLPDIQRVPAQFTECFSTGIGCGQPAYRSSDDTSEQETREYLILLLAILRSHLISLDTTRCTQAIRHRIFYPTLRSFASQIYERKEKLNMG